MVSKPRHLPQQFLIKGIRFMWEIRNEVLTEEQKEVSCPINQKPTGKLAES